MGPESCTPSSSPGGKRGRDPEDEVYIDNLNSHKRYLSEIMASSLNGLTVGDSLADNLMESPARSESSLYARDEMCLQYSPMSEDSDDTRYCETPIITSSSQPDSAPSSPVSPYRGQRPLNGFSSSYPMASSQTCNLNAVASSQCRQRGSDSDGRFPSSPSDICHSADLRRAALLRSVQMRTQPTGLSAFELPIESVQESEPIVEAEEQLIKSLEGERDYQIEDCSGVISEPKFIQEKRSRVFTMSTKEEEPVG